MQLTEKTHPLVDELCNFVFLLPTEIILHIGSMLSNKSKKNLRLTSSFIEKLMNPFFKIVWKPNLVKFSSPWIIERDLSFMEKRNLKERFEIICFDLIFQRDDILVRKILTSSLPNELRITISFFGGTFDLSVQERIRNLYIHVTGDIERVSPFISIRKISNNLEFLYIWVYRAQFSLKGDFSGLLEFKKEGYGSQIIREISKCLRQCKKLKILALNYHHITIEDLIEIVKIPKYELCGCFLRDSVSTDYGTIWIKLLQKTCTEKNRQEMQEILSACPKIT